jgi:hypothetical protein
MKAFQKIIITLFTIFIVSFTAYSNADTNIASSYSQLLSPVIYFDGIPQVNTNTAADNTDIVLQNWCNNSCYPTTKFRAVDLKTGIPVDVRVWAKDYITGSDGITTCFTEFIEYTFALPTIILGKSNTIYTSGNPHATCGAPMDAKIVPPKNPNATVILAGGGQGNIIAGNGLFLNNISGTYNDRVFVEYNPTKVNPIVQYDALYIYLMIK